MSIGYYDSILDKMISAAQVVTVVKKMKPTPQDAEQQKYEFNYYCWVTAARHANSTVA